MSFDSNKPVYIIKPVAYGSGSVYPISDHPIPFHNIPARYRTSEYIQQQVPKELKASTTLVDDTGDDALGEMVFNPEELAGEKNEQKVQTKAEAVKTSTKASTKTSK